MQYRKNAAKAVLPGAVTNRTVFLSLLMILGLFAACGPRTAFANEQAPLKVAVYVCPPFVIADEGGGFSGLGIFLWEEVAKSIGRDYKYEKTRFNNVLTDVGSEKYDIGISCVTITSKREGLVDFSHSYYGVQLGIATKRQNLFAAAINIFLDLRFELFLVGFLGLAMSVGAIFFYFEHKINDKLYAMKSTRGQIIEALLMGILFTTKGPFNYYEFKTLQGRVLNVFLAVFSTFAFAAITAMLASTFTLGLMSSEIKRPQDLAKVQVGAVEGTTAAGFLDRNRIIYNRYESTKPLLAALDAGEVDAIIDDAPLLKYFLKENQEEGKYQDSMLLPYLFEIQNYGIVLKPNSPLREEINRELLKTLETSAWRRLVKNYFGEK